MDTNFSPKDIDITTIDDVQELLDLQDECDIAIAIMSVQVAEANLKKDFDTLRNVKIASVYTKQQRAKCALKAARLRKDAKGNRQVEIEKAFMNATIKLFDRDSISEVFDEVYEQYPYLREKV